MLFVFWFFDCCGMIWVWVVCDVFLCFVLCMSFVSLCNCLVEILLCFNFLWLFILVWFLNVEWCGLVDVMLDVILFMIDFIFDVEGEVLLMLFVCICVIYLIVIVLFLFMFFMWKMLGVFGEWLVWCSIVCRNFFVNFMWLNC